MSNTTEEFLDEVEEATSTNENDAYSFFYRPSNSTTHNSTSRNVRDEMTRRFFGDPTTTEGPGFNLNHTMANTGRTSGATGALSGYFRPGPITRAARDVPPLETIRTGPREPFTIREEPSVGILNTAAVVRARDFETPETAEEQRANVERLRLIADRAVAQASWGTVVGGVNRHANITPGVTHWAEALTGIATDANSRMLNVPVEYAINMDTIGTTAGEIRGAGITNGTITSNDWDEQPYSASGQTAGFWDGSSSRNQTMARGGLTGPMEKALIQFLKDKLTLKVDTTWAGKDIEVTVSLKLAETGEELLSDTSSIEIPDND